MQIKDEDGNPFMFQKYTQSYTRKIWFHNEIWEELNTGFYSTTKRVNKVMVGSFLSVHQITQKIRRQLNIYVARWGAFSLSFPLSTKSLQTVLTLQYQSMLVQLLSRTSGS